MNQRTYRALNVFALLFLLFAGYLNFFKKDKEPATQSYHNEKVADPSNGTVLISNPEQYLKMHAKSTVAQTPGLQN
jgi:hypothetical protein